MVAGDASVGDGIHRRGELPDGVPGPGELPDHEAMLRLHLERDLRRDRAHVHAHPGVPLGEVEEVAKVVRASLKENLLSNDRPLSRLDARRLGQNRGALGSDGSRIADVETPPLLEACRRLVHAPMLAKIESIY
ncbi:hypothetical protein ACFPRL_24760 [Pseudoclavibacter helvolus]